LIARSASDKHTSLKYPNFTKYTSQQRSLCRLTGEVLQAVAKLYLCLSRQEKMGLSTPTQLHHIRGNNLLEHSKVKTDEPRFDGKMREAGSHWKEAVSKMPHPVTTASRMSQR